MKILLKLLCINIFILTIFFVNTAILSQNRPNANQDIVLIPKISDTEFIELLIEQIYLEEKQYRYEMRGTRFGKKSCNNAIRNTRNFRISQQLLHETILFTAVSNYNDYVNFLVKDFLEELISRPLKTAPRQKSWTVEEMLIKVDEIKRTIAKQKEFVALRDINKKSKIVDIESNNNI